MQTKYNSIEYEKKKKNPGKFLCMGKEEIIIFTYNVISLYVKSYL